MNKIITTIEQDRERFEDIIGEVPEGAIYRHEDRETCVMCGHPTKMDVAVKNIQSHLSLSIEHVLESLKEEVGATKRHVCSEKSECCAWSVKNDVTCPLFIGYNSALTEVSTLIDEVIKHVKK